jgi:hypothetical protein
MTASFCFAHQQNAGTVSDPLIEPQKPCCSRESAPQPGVGAAATDPVVQILQGRFLRAWQKMVDEGVDWFAVQGERDRGGLS